MTADYIRTKRHGCFRLAINHFGSYMLPTEDPEGIDNFSLDDLKVFEIRPDLAQIPSELWTAWVKLAFKLLDYDEPALPAAAETIADGNYGANTRYHGDTRYGGTYRYGGGNYRYRRSHDLEVSVRLLVSDTDPTKYKIVVPRQTVNSGQVVMPELDDCIDLISGEKHTVFPPLGWIPCGSTHSHNTMAAFWSATDDAAELGDPGMHAVIGDLRTDAEGNRTYAVKASITSNLKRFEVPYDLVIDATASPESEYHPDVLEYVSSGSAASVLSNESYYGRNSDGFPSSLAKRERPTGSELAPSTLNAGGRTERLSRAEQKALIIDEFYDMDFKEFVDLLAERIGVEFNDTFEDLRAGLITLQPLMEAVKQMRDGYRDLVDNPITVSVLDDKDDDLTTSMLLLTSAPEPSNEPAHSTAADAPLDHATGQAEPDRVAPEPATHHPQF